MIDMAERLASAIDEDIARIAALRAEIDRLPDTKVVNIVYRVTREGRDIVENASKGGIIENINLGGAENIGATADALGRLADAFDRTAQAEVRAGDAAAAADRVMSAQVRDATRVAQAIYETSLDLDDLAAAEERAQAATGLRIGQMQEEIAYEQRLIEMSDLARDHTLMEAQAEVEAARESTRALREQEAAVRQVEAAQAQMAQELRDISRAERENAGALGDYTRQLMEEEYQIARIEEAMADVPKRAAGDLAQVAASLTFFATAAGAVTRVFGLTTTAIHMIIMGTAEFLAVFLPAMYAAAAGAAVLYQGLVEVVGRGISSLYTAAEALGPMVNQTAGDFLGLGHSLQTAQDRANPLAYEMLGEAILGLRLMTQQTSGGLSKFSDLGLKVSDMLAHFGAEIVVDLRDNMGKINSLIASAATDLQMFGQILGNIGHALLNFAAAMPGLAEIILKIVDGITQLIKWFSNLPAPLLTTIFIFEEMYRWSGALVSIFGVIGRAIGLLGTLGIPVFIRIGQNFGMMAGNLITGVALMITNFGALVSKITGGEGAIAIDGAFARMAKGLQGFAALMTGPWGIAIGLGAIALGALAIAIMHVKTATDVLIDGINKTVAAASNLTVLNQIGAGMEKVMHATTSAVNTLTHTMSANQQEMHQGKFAFEDYAGAVYAAGVPVGQLQGEQKKLFTENMNVLQGAGAISKAYGVNFVTALGLADAAGVKLANGQLKLGRNANAAGIQIESLVLGYQRLDQSGTILANSMSAVNIQAQIQGTKVSQVNQAWDSFIQMSTSLTGAFASFKDDLSQLGNIAPATGSRIRAFAGDSTLSLAEIQQALTGFSGTSAQVWQAFNQSIQQANTFMDNLRQAAAAGVVPQQQFTQAAASLVKQLLPFAKDSHAAVAELSALAQEAGGPATSSYKTLKEWADRNSVSSQRFTGMIDNLTQKLSNVTQVARNFAGTLQQDVLDAIAQAGISTANITGLTQKYTQALMENGPQSVAVTQAQSAFNSELRKLGFSHRDVIQLDQELTTAYGRNAAAADNTAGKTTNLKNDFQDTQGHVRHLAAQIWNNLIPALSHVPANVTTHIRAIASGSGGIRSTVSGLSGMAATQILFGGLASGGRIPGFGGGDSVLAMLEPGETVVPKHLTHAVAPLMKAHGIPGFASGGLVDPSGPERFEAAQASRMEALTMTAAMNKILNSYNQQVKQLQTQLNGVSSPIGHPSGSIFSWISKALALTGAPQGWATDLLTIAAYESGYNVNAINLSDSNAKAGDPSRGLMQMIMSTFLAYHQAGTSFNIYDPVANIAAAIRYIEARYGSVFNVPGIKSLAHGGPYVGYDSGGLLMPGLTMAYNGTGRPERVVPPHGGGEATVIHNVVNIDGRQVFEALKPVVYQYNSRNSGNGNINGIWKPR